MAACATRGELDGVEIEDGTLYIACTKPTAPDAARLLAGRLYGMLPRVRVTEVVSDVAQATGFAACFTHLRTGHPPADVPALLAAVLADATRGVSYHHLVNVAQWHVTEDNYAAARAVIVDAHHRHSMSAIWGDGTNSSSTDSISAPVDGPDPAVTLTPSTGSTPAWWSTPPSRDSTAPRIPRSSRPPPARRPTCWTGCTRRRTEPACASPSPVHPAMAVRRGTPPAGILPPPGRVSRSHLRNQSFRASGLSLLTTAIVHWNTVYLDQAVRHLRFQGITVPAELLAHVALLGWEHIALTGDYDWNTARSTDGLRLPRAVPEAFTLRAA